MTDVEARTRLGSVLSVLEHETPALRALDDPRLAGVLETIAVLRAEIVATLGELHHGAEPNGDGSSS